MRRDDGGKAHRLHRERMEWMYGSAEARPMHQPKPGFYLLRTVKGGPLVPARITYEPTRDPETGEPLDRSWYWRAEIAGKQLADPAIDFLEAKVDQVWWRGKPIGLAEFRYRMDSLAWARQHDEHAPEARPYEPIDLNSSPPVF